MSKQLTYDQVVKKAEEFLDAIEIQEVLEGGKSETYKIDDISESKAKNATEISLKSYDYAVMFATAIIKNNKVYESAMICEQIAKEHTGMWRASANKCAARIRRILGS